MSLDLPWAWFHAISKAAASIWAKQHRSTPKGARWWPAPCDLFEAGSECSPQCRACGSLYLRENGYSSYWGDSETTLAIYLKHIICEIGWWFHRSVPNPNLSRCQLHKCGFFCVTQISKARKKFDGQKSVSIASALSPLQFIDLESSLLNIVWLG